MITVITGIPGSGKTLMTVDKLLQPLVGQSIKYTDGDGDEVTAPRTIFSNVNGLLLEHEKIDSTHLKNWHTWAKPGSVICFDEVQKAWPLIATGSKVTDDIMALETHRHMGVDFIIMTQHPMMIHANIVRLAGRHVHLRRVANAPMAFTYEWDGVSRSLGYKNAMAKGTYWYNRKVYRMYKSAEAHTKQPRRIPPVLIFMGLAVAAMVFGGPMVYARWQERFHPGEKAAAAAEKPAQGAPAAAGVPKPPTSAVSAPVPVLPAVAQAPTFDGCIRVAEQCRCMDRRAVIVPVPVEQCLSVSGFGRGEAASVGADTETLAQRKAEQGDLDALAARRISRQRLSLSDR